VLAFVFLPVINSPAGEPENRKQSMKPSAPASDTEFEWQASARMPETNHDITGAVLDGKFYVAGGTTELQNPKRAHAFDEVWELDPLAWKWRVAGKLSRARVYCATAAFAGKIWIIGGNVPERDASHRAVNTVELYDPETGGVTAGPQSPVARPMPVALTTAGRLYVMGNPQGEVELPGKIESIGEGENTWRAEPDGPCGMGPLAGAALDGKLYVVIPKTGFAIFDTMTRTWEVLAPPSIPRSCQMTAYRGEIWMMGGRGIADGRQTLIFNPETRAWRNGPPLPRELAWGAAGVVGDLLIVAGGHSTGEYMDATYVLRKKLP
jgi:hypothetical protein